MYYTHYPQKELKRYQVKAVRDFLINAGGIINVYEEYRGDYNRERAYATADKIYDTCLQILNYAEDESISSQEAAIKIAQDRIDAIGKLKLTR